MATGRYAAVSGSPSARRRAAGFDASWETGHLSRRGPQAYGAMRMPVRLRRGPATARRSGRDPETPVRVDPAEFRLPEGEPRGLEPGDAACPFSTVRPPSEGESGICPSGPVLLRGRFSLSPPGGRVVPPRGGTGGSPGEGHHRSGPSPLFWPFPPVGHPIVARTAALPGGHGALTGLRFRARSGGHHCGWQVTPRSSTGNGLVRRASPMSLKKSGAWPGPQSSGPVVRSRVVGFPPRRRGLLDGAPRRGGAPSAGRCHRPRRADAGEHGPGRVRTRACEWPLGAGRRVRGDPDLHTAWGREPHGPGDRPRGEFRATGRGARVARRKRRRVVRRVMAPTGSRRSTTVSCTPCSQGGRGTHPERVGCKACRRGRG